MSKKAENVTSAAAAVFLRQQLFRQASIEGVSLSELELQMVCAPEGRAGNKGLVAEFESRHDLLVFEAKISTLLHHAYERFSKENPKDVDAWERARQALAREDHYLFHIWNVLPAAETPPKIGSIIRIGIGLLIALGLTIGIFSWIAQTRSH